VCDGGLVAGEYENFTLGVRPEDIVLGCDKGSGLSFPATVTDTRELSFRKTHVTTFKYKGIGFCAETNEKTAAVRDGIVNFSFAKFHLFDKKSGARVRTVENNRLT
jgi:hypothetical protein